MEESAMSAAVEESFLGDSGHGAAGSVNNGNSIAAAFAVESNDWAANDRHGLSLSMPLASLVSVVPTVVMLMVLKGTYRPAAFPIIYLALQLTVATFAFRLKDAGPIVRWLAGFVSVAVLSGFKTVAIVAPVKSVPARVVIYAMTALWECSTANLVFVGRQRLEKLGIVSYEYAWAAALCPSGVKFPQVATATPNLPQKSKAARWSVPASLLFGAGLQWVLSLPSISELIRAWTLLELEVMTVLTSISILVFDVPGLLWDVGMGFLGKNVYAILPYGAIYFSTSSRSFWQKWSRPAGALIRSMVYVPLGGATRSWIAVPAMFLINATGHYDVSRALNGDPAVKWWNIVFGVLGLTVTWEIMLTRYLIQQNGHGRLEQGQVELPRWFKVARWAVAHISLRVALFIMLRFICKIDLLTFTNAHDPHR